MAETSRERKLPKTAISPLIEYCGTQVSESKDSAAEIFKRYLELMKKYERFFFSKPWPEQPPSKPNPKNLELSDEEWKFLEGGRSYEEKCERFLVFCLRRNISLQGFDRKHFEGDEEYFGARPCWDCVVHDAMRLREDITLEDRYKRENEEKMKSGEPSDVTRTMYEHYNEPEVVRKDKMRVTKLRFYDEVGFTAGKSCEIRNMYKCPHGKKSKRLVKDGGLARNMWELVEYYDRHWNRSRLHSSSKNEEKWYHFDEPSVIDVTSYEDIMNAAEDGRLQKILDEFLMHEKETGNRY